ncbi:MULTISPECIES: hypothetical protein [unclassified Pseudonocardia]|uniref:hypothetical protein n=1 Tax=unclassified Pseudonocardia TaxID=2619320 RepID=UPI001AC493CF|nr:MULTISPECIES: hypothetical protein [unclassified Pseudonocardia]MBN9102128.1 hypothetical protein [Pseudonocardia sp.]
MTWLARLSVTAPIGAAATGLPGVTGTSSSSADGGSVVTPPAGTAPTRPRPWT